MFCLDEQFHIKDHLMYLQCHSTICCCSIKRDGITAT